VRRGSGEKAVLGVARECGDVDVPGGGSVSTGSSMNDGAIDGDGDEGGAGNVANGLASFFGVERMCF
jgi:hypothetical protein